jgi:hypothetical protein
MAQYPNYELVDGVVRNRITSHECGIIINPVVDGYVRSLHLSVVIERLSGVYSMKDKIDQLVIDFPGLEDYIPLIYNLPPSQREFRLILSLY